MASASSSPSPFCPPTVAVSCCSLGCVKISGVSAMCPRSITSRGGTASKFKTAVGRIADDRLGVQSSLPAIVSFVHVVPGTNGLSVECRYGSRSMCHRCQRACKPVSASLSALSLSARYCLAGINEILSFSLFSTLLVNPSQQQYSRTHDYAAQCEY